MRKWLFRVAIALAGVMILLVAGAVVPRPLWPTARTEDQLTRQFVLLSNPIHTDIAIPLDDRVLEKFAALLRAGVRADLDGARNLVFGWGGRAFYLATPNWSDLRPGPVLSALTVDQSVMHVDVLGQLELPQPSARQIFVSERDFESLLDFIVMSFRKGPDGPIRIPEAGYGSFDAFFEANGYFNAFLGCNTWTAKALREAGLRTGWWNPLPQSLVLSLGLHN